jgi:dsDNA-specific endonuclease/ATPase MutS2
MTLIIEIKKLHCHAHLAIKKAVARFQWLHMKDDEPPIHYEVTPELDLHTFRPEDVSLLLDSYFEECQRMGFGRVRLIHGKGSGALRTGVHGKLEQHPAVRSYTWPASHETGGWGATWVELVL